MFYNANFLLFSSLLIFLYVVFVLIEINEIVQIKLLQEDMFRFVKNTTSVSVIVIIYVLLVFTYYYKLVAC